MASLSHGCLSSSPSLRPNNKPPQFLPKPRLLFSCYYSNKTHSPSLQLSLSKKRAPPLRLVPKCANSTNNPIEEDKEKKSIPFGYTRKDVLLIGVGVTVLGIGLKSGLEYAGVDPLQAGNVVQLVLVLGLTVGWISTYIFRVGNKEMTYAQQLRDYEKKVMEKRLEGLTEAELESLLQQVEEEKQRIPGGEQVK